MQKALVVGIDNYVGKPLSGCVHDARSVAEVLSTHGDDEPNFDVKLITAPQASPDGSIPEPRDSPMENSPKGGITRVLLRREIQTLFAGDSEVALFYFSGHGVITSIGGFVLTSDFQSYDEGVAMDEILTYANHSATHNKVIILDCCHSGEFGSPNISGSNVCQLAQGMSVLTASRESEQAMESKGGHGVFTSLLIDALKGGAADLRGHITPGSVYAYIDEALGSWDQRPIFKTNVTRSISLRKILPAVPHSTLRKIIDHFPHPEDEHKLAPEYESTTPSPDPAKVAIFKELQKLHSVGLVVPVGEDYMYLAAIHSKSCKLTPIGRQYWRLVKEKRL